MHRIERNIESRRRLLRACAVTTGTALAPAPLFGQERVAPSERITVGVIGLGSRGFNLINDLLANRDAQIVAVCDVDSFHYRDRPWGQGAAFGTTPAKALIEKKDPSTRGLRVTKNYREICAADAIDAVVIATPDHWHAQCTLEAINNGKDVYCEKPLTHTFTEGQRVYRAANERGTIFQTGSQQRSADEFWRAKELIRNGQVGKLKSIEIGLPPGYDKPQGDTTVSAPPDHLDYEMWCGPAEKLPYMRARHHRWWRGHRAFGGGVLMDWIGHHNDIAHWAMGVDHSGPVTVEAVGWKFPATPIYNTPEQYEIKCTYASGIETSIASRHKIGVTFHGEDGWLYVTRGKLLASNESLLEASFDRVNAAGGYSNSHMRNFLDCIRSKEPCMSPAETTHRSITPGHLSFVSHAMGRSLSWDPVKEEIIGDDAAMELLMQNHYRASWNG